MLYFSGSLVLCRVFIHFWIFNPSFAGLQFFTWVQVLLLGNLFRVIVIFSVSFVSRVSVLFAVSVLYKVLVLFTFQGFSPLHGFSPFQGFSPL